MFMCVYVPCIDIMFCGRFFFFFSVDFHFRTAFKQLIHSLTNRFYIHRWNYCGWSRTHACLYKWIHLHVFAIKTVKVNGLCCSTLDSTTWWQYDDFFYFTWWLFTLDLKKIGCFTVKIHFFVWLCVWAWVWIFYLCFEIWFIFTVFQFVRFLQCNIYLKMAYFQMRGEKMIISPDICVFFLGRKK